MPRAKRPEKTSFYTQAGVKRPCWQPCSRLFQLWQRGRGKTKESTPVPGPCSPQCRCMELPSTWHHRAGKHTPASTPRSPARVSNFPQDRLFPFYINPNKALNQSLDSLVLWLPGQQATPTRQQCNFRLITLLKRYMIYIYLHNGFSYLIGEKGWMNFP